MTRSTALCTEHRFHQRHKHITHGLDVLRPRSRALHAKRALVARQRLILSLSFDLHRLDHWFPDGLPDLLVKDASRIGFGQVSEISVGPSPAAAADVSMLAGSAVSFEVLSVADRLQDWMIVPNVKEIIMENVA